MNNTLNLDSSIVVTGTSTTGGFPCNYTTTDFLSPALAHQMMWQRHSANIGPAPPPPLPNLAWLGKRVDEIRMKL